MQFSEGNQDFEAIPPWASYLLEVGYRWPVHDPGRRRVAVFSMPCDSAAAGLITLGALVRDLGDHCANDRQLHRVRIVQYARQYLRSCLPCKLRVCNPKTRKCGHLKEAAGRVRCIEYPDRPFQIETRSDIESGDLYFKSRTWAYNPNINHIGLWHIDDEPPLQTSQAHGVLEPDAFTGIWPAVPIYPPNLSTSYSGLCLVERASAPDGQPTTSREMCEGISFHTDERAWTLGTLLTIKGWGETGISRTASFNCRSMKLDRTGIEPKLLVADGHTAFLKVRDLERFGQSDIIGVVDRNQPRELIERIRAKVTADDWYQYDIELLQGFPDKPNGISGVAIRRTSN